MRAVAALMLEGTCFFFGAILQDNAIEQLFLRLGKPVPITCERGSSQRVCEFAGAPVNFSHAEVQLRSTEAGRTLWSPRSNSRNRGTPQHRQPGMSYATIRRSARGRPVMVEGAGRVKLLGGPSCPGARSRRQGMVGSI